MGELDEDAPRFELVAAVVEHRHHGFEAVGLVRGVVGRDLGSFGVGVGDEDAVAQIGIGGRRCVGIGGGLRRCEWNRREEKREEE